MNTIEQLFHFVEQLYQLEVCLVCSRLLPGIPILALFQNLRQYNNKMTLPVTGTAVFTLPPELDLGLATPINCALATMVAVRRMVRHALGPAGARRPNKSVIIYGAGLLGLYGSALFKEDEFTVESNTAPGKKVATI